jgi:hypothetical protein
MCALAMTALIIIFIDASTKWLRVLRAPAEPAPAE